MESGQHGGWKIALYRDDAAKQAIPEEADPLTDRGLIVFDPFFQVTAFNLSSFRIKQVGERGQIGVYERREKKVSDKKKDQFRLM